MRMMRTAVVASAALTMALLGFGATIAGASPSYAPSVRTGSLYCGPQGFFTLTSNAGNSQAGMTWDSFSFVWQYNDQFSGTGIFVPTAYDVTVDSGGQTSQFNVTKSGSNGPDCEFGEGGPGFSAIGTAGGTLIWTTYTGGPKPHPGPVF